MEAIKEQQKTISSMKTENELRMQSAELEIAELKAAVNKLLQQSITEEAINPDRF